MVSCLIFQAKPNIYIFIISIECILVFSEQAKPDIYTYIIS